MLRWNYRCVGLLGLVAVLALPVVGRAGGLIQQLPADGSWVTLKVDSKRTFGGKLQSGSRELKVASVGKQNVDGQPARWIEFATEFEGRRMVAKMLIPEKFLTADQDSFDHVAKAWARNREGIVAELPKDRLRGIVVFAIGVPHFDKLEVVDTETVKIELGEYPCDRSVGHVEREVLPGNKAKFDGELWTCDQVPFGLVKAKVRVAFPKGNIDSELTVILSGTNAMSELPDAK